MEERRKYERRPVQEGALAVFRPPPSRLCQIENISMGGMKTRYVEFEKAGHDFSDLTLLKTGEHVMLKGLPFSIILDKELNSPPTFAGLPLRCSYIKFGHLTEEKRNKLEEFIRLVSC